jgi:hypothetical protein
VAALSKGSAAQAVEDSKTRIEAIIKARVFDDFFIVNFPIY